MLKDIIKRHKKSLKSKIFLYFLILMTVTTIILGIGSYVMSIKILKRKVSNSYLETLTYVGNTVQKELNQVEQVSEFIFINDKIKEILTKDYENKGEYLMDLKAIDAVFLNYSIADVFNYIPALKIYGDNGTEISYGDQVYAVSSKKIKEEWNKNEKNKIKGSIIWNNLHMNTTTKPLKGKYVLSLFRQIKNENYSKNIGLLYLELEPNIFADKFDKMQLDNNANIMIVDNDENIVYHTNPDYIFRKKYDFIDIEKIDEGKGEKIIDTDAGKQMVTYYTIPNYDWTIYGITPMKALTNENKKILKFMIPMFGVISIFASFIWYYILTKIIKPISELSETMDSVKEGNTLVEFQYDGEDEIKELSDSFNYMIERVHILFNNLLEEQYKTLMTEINPHFLYNTLNSIRWMAIIQKADNIKEAIDALSRLLLNTINQTERFVTIEEELQNLRDYVYIQKIRYNDRFQIKYYIVKDVLNQKCLRFMLQPFVENAIFHGIDPEKNMLTIEISIYEEVDNIVFVVKDDGVGMTQEKLKEIFEAESDSSGIGIKNVNNRIKMIYGQSYGVEIKSKEGSYTEVKMELPKHMDKRIYKLYNKKIITF